MKDLKPKIILNSTLFRWWLARLYFNIFYPKNILETKICKGYKLGVIFYSNNLRYAYLGNNIAVCIDEEKLYKDRHVSIKHRGIISILTILRLKPNIYENY